MTSRFKDFLCCFFSLIAFCQPSFSQEEIKYRAERVTVTAYCQFLKGVAATDRYNLYDPKMACDPPMINRQGLPGAYRYQVSKLADSNGPILYVNRLSQARFCNWKENGEKNSDTETGVYNLTFITNGIDPLNFPLQAAIAARYRVSSSNDSTSDPLLGLGSSTAYFIIDHVVENDASFSKEANNLVMGDIGSTTEISKSESATDFLLGNAAPIRMGLLSGTSDPSSESSEVTPSIVTKNSHPITIDLVTIDAPNNPYDSKDYGALGAVTNIFQIGKYDVTAEQYCALLKAVATSDDRYGLYDTNMGADTNVACIIRIGETNPYDYAVIPGREKFPITYASGVRAARFCNWMEHGQPIGVEGPETTEKGAFDLTYTTNVTTNYVTTPPVKNFNGTTTPGSVQPVIEKTVSLAVTANMNAHWSLPTEDQWYKAAYYKKSTVGWDGFTNNDGCYYAYGTGADDIPTNGIQGAKSNKNAVNFCLDDNYTLTNGPHITPVGTFEKTKSPFGLYDMSGNVDQWTLFPNGAINGVTQWSFGVRGGSWQSRHTSSGVKLDGSVDPDTGEIGKTSLRRIFPVGTKVNTIGFRLVYNVPPPLESYSHFIVSIPEKLGARFWDGIWQTLTDLNPFYFICNASTASMDILNWTFGLIIPEFAQRFLKARIGVKPVAIATESAAVEGGAAVGAVELEAAAIDVAVVLPPPLDIIIPTGLMVGGLICAYYGHDIQNSMAGFGIAIDGLLNLFRFF